MAREGSTQQILALGRARVQGTKDEGSLDQGPKDLGNLASGKRQLASSTRQKAFQRI